MIADITILIRKNGQKKSHKLELFRGTKFICNAYSLGKKEKGPADKFRVRCDRKWLGQQHTWMSFYTTTEVMALLDGNIQKMCD